MKIMSIRQAAEMLNVHPATLRRWDKSGKLKPVKINSRGDRMYEEESIIRLLKYGENVFGEYTIEWRSNGFFMISNGFYHLAKIIVKKHNFWSGFAFYINDRFSSSNIIDARLDEIALNKVKELLSNGKVNDGDILTFEYYSSTGFVEVENPDWFDAKYSKQLSSRLRVRADHSCPIDISGTGWRVSIVFLTKTDDNWLITPISRNVLKDSVKIECLIWIRADEIIKKGLPNTAKSAETIAVNFIINRFSNINNNADLASCADVFIPDGNWLIDKNKQPCFIVFTTKKEPKKQNKGMLIKNEVLSYSKPTKSWNVIDKKDILNIYPA